MFKAGGVLGTVGTKIAHTSTLPSLGNKDLKLLQDLIVAEKNVVTTLQKLSVDYGRAAEALKAWGLGEGDDLGDVLTHSCTLLMHVSTAYGQYSTHHHPIRTALKSVRTREEQLDVTKRHRRSVVSKAEATEKKLSKMGQENKNLAVTIDTLTRLREEIRALDTEILTEEARLGDYKRTVAKDCMGLKLGGLVECSEKGVVAGHIGKELIEDIPLETTFPGQARVPYGGYERTAQLTSDAARAIGEITFNQSSGGSGFAQTRGSTSSDPNQPQQPQHTYQSNTYPSSPNDYNPPTLPLPRSVSGMSTSEFMNRSNGNSPQPPPAGEFGEVPRIRVGGDTSSQYSASTYPAASTGARSGHRKDDSVSSSMDNSLAYQYNPPPSTEMKPEPRAKSESPPRRYQAPPLSGANPWEAGEENFSRPYIPPTAQEQEAAANAAAARDLQRELDSMGGGYQSSPLPSTSQNSLPKRPSFPSTTAADSPKMISAAAFRRPSPRTPQMSVDSTTAPSLSYVTPASTGPLQPQKKGLPSSPYPTTRLDGAAMSGTFYTPREEPEKRLSELHSRQGSQSPTTPTIKKKESLPPPEYGDIPDSEEGYANYTAYQQHSADATERVGEGPGTLSTYGSPTAPGFDHGSLGNVRVANYDDRDGGGYGGGGF